MKKIYYILFLFLNVVYSQKNIDNVMLWSLQSSSEVPNLTDITGCSSKEGTYVVKFNYSGFVSGIDNTFRVLIIDSYDNEFEMLEEITINSSGGNGSYTTSFDGIEFPTTGYDPAEYYRIKVEYKNDPTVNGTHNKFFTLKTVFPSSIIIEGPTIVCPGENITIKSNINRSTYNYIWKKDNVEIDRGIGLYSIDINDVGVYKYAIEINGRICESGSGSTVSKVTEIKFDNLEEINGGVSNGCFDGSIIIKPKNIKIGNGTNYYENIDEEKLNYQWSKNGIVLPNENNKNLKIIKSGNYSLKITYCNINQTGNFTANIGDIEIESKETVFCEEAPIVKIRSINNSSSYSYKWYKNNAPLLGESNNSIDVGSKGKYYLEVTQNICTFKSNEVEINDFEDIKGSISFSELADSIELIPPANKIIKINGVDSIYVEKDGEEFYTGKELEITVNESGEYEVFAFIGECYISKKYSITIIDISKLRDDIKNIFTPNESPWILPNYINDEDTEIVVINRNGSILFKQKNYQNDWLGLDPNGNKLGEGVYFYFIIKKDKQLINGSLTIL